MSFYLFDVGGLRAGDVEGFPGPQQPIEAGHAGRRGKSVAARALSRYFAHEGLSTYTHVTDQHTTYGTKIIVATKREAHYVLDEILGNATDIPITEHATGHGGSIRSHSGSLLLILTRIRSSLALSLNPPGIVIRNASGHEGRCPLNCDNGTCDGSINA